MITGDFDNIDNRRRPADIVINGLLVVYLFLGIYAPCMPLVSTRKLVLLLSAFFVVICLVKKRDAFISEGLLKVLIAFVPFLAYFAIAQLAHSVGSPENARIYFDTARSMLFVFVYGAVVAISITAAIQAFGISKDRFMQLLIATATMQLLCVVLAWLFPEVKQFFTGLVLTYSSNDVIKAAIERDYYARCFGLAENLFDAFGYTCSILIILTYAYGLDRKRPFLIALAIVMFIMPLLNARTGVVLSLVGLVVIFFYFFSVKNIGRYVLVAAAAIFIVFVVIPVLPFRWWLYSGFEATVSLITGAESSSRSSAIYEVILGSHLFFPANELLGAGASPESLVGRGSDPGYVQCIWRFGVVGSLLLFFGVVFLFWSAYHENQDDKAIKCLAICVGVIFFAYLFKLFSFTNLEAVFLLSGMTAAALTKNVP